MSILAPIFLSIENQERIFLYLKIVFGCSCLFNTISLFFLVKLTPLSQAGVRNYLVAIQIALIVSDVHLEMGMQPIPLFPLIGGYGVGFLLKAGVTLLTEMCVTLVIYVITGMIIVLCLVYRHQTVVLEGNAFKFRKKTVQVLHVFLLTAPIVPGVIFAFSGYDTATLDRMLHADPRNVSWMKDRGYYYILPRTVYVQTTIYIFLFILIFCSVIILIIFGHMFYVLHNSSGKRSIKSITLISRSLKTLFAQLFIPMNFFIIPATVIFIGLSADDILSFETMIMVFLILPLHSFFHNLILLTVTPTYRHAIISFVRKPRLRVLPSQTG